MRKYLLVLGLLSNLFVNAQSKEDAKAEAAPGVVDGEPYTVSSTYRNKNLIIAKQSTGNNQYALLDYTSRKKITPFVFEFITRIGNDDKFQVLVNTRYGVINTIGQWIIPCIYDEMNIITIDGVAYYIVSKNNRYGMINGQNEVIIPFEYEEISKSHYAAMDVVLRRNGKMGVLNFISHKMIVPVIYDRVYVMSSKLIRVGNGPLNSLLNINGEKISDWYTELERIPNAFAQEFFIAAKDGKYGIVSDEGKIITPLQYDRIANSYFLLIATKNHKLGLLSKEGKVVVNLDYDNIEELDGYYLVKKNNRYGLIHRSGAVVFPNEYETLSRVTLNSDSYGSSYMVGTKNGKRGMIDVAKRKVHIEFIYDDFIGVPKNVYGNVEAFDSAIIAIKGGKYGMIALSGSVLLPFAYDDIQYLNSFLVIARKNGKYGVVDIHNNDNVLLPFEYEFVNYNKDILAAYKDSYEKYRVSSDKVTKMDN